MKKILYALLGLVIVIGVAVVVGPGLIDWRPRIAAAVLAETGRELRIDTLSLSLVPRIQVVASGVHFANAPGATEGDMLAVGNLTLQAELLPLLSRRLVIDQLVIKKIRRSRLRSTRPVGPIGPSLRPHRPLPRRRSPQKAAARASGSSSATSASSRASLPIATPPPARRSPPRASCSTPAWLIWRAHSRSRAR